MPGPLLPLEYDAEELAKRVGPDWSATLLSAYGWMVLGRTLDHRMLGLQRQGRIGFYGPATGQEAVSVGAALALSENDWVFPGLREQLLALVRGHSLSSYAHHLFADRLDPAMGRQMPCHPSAREVRYVSMSSVIGTQISEAVGLAYAMRMKKDPGVSVAFFGDGATSSNDFHAGLNFAAVFRLPVLFCLTNNQWAISLPVERQSGVAVLAEKARSYGLPGTRVDGTDIVEVYRSTRDALATVRAGGGPALLEFVTFRMTPHSSSDDPTRYQPAGFLERGRERDPLGRLEELLRRTHVLGDDLAREVEAEAEREVRSAIAEAEATAPPGPDTLTEDVFAPRG
jgi:pyruvate dehydrogenase E1 component alpha subunit/2-oxoisovalerate dehydrogenase E1 component alpha subunit